MRSWGISRDEVLGITRGEVKEERSTSLRKQPSFFTARERRRTAVFADYQPVPGPLMFFAVHSLEKRTPGFKASPHR